MKLPEKIKGNPSLENLEDRVHSLIDYLAEREKRTCPKCGKQLKYWDNYDGTGAYYCHDCCYCVAKEPTPPQPERSCEHPKVDWSPVWKRCEICGDMIPADKAWQPRTEPKDNFKELYKDFPISHKLYKDKSEEKQAPCPDCIHEFTSFCKPVSCKEQDYYLFEGNPKPKEDYKALVDEAKLSKHKFASWTDIINKYELAITAMEKRIKELTK